MRNARCPETREAVQPTALHHGQPAMMPAIRTGVACLTEQKAAALKVSNTDADLGFPKESQVPQTILLIQHESTSAGIVREALLDARDAQIHVECAGTCAEGLARLTRAVDGSHPAIDAVLTNLSLPDSQGTTTFDRLYQAAPQIPILVICAASEEQLARMAVQRGAQDYLFEERLDRYLLPKTVRSMIQRAVIAESLFVEKERAEVTLNSIGDAVLCTDEWGKVTYLNAVAELLTGWQCAEARGRPLDTVFHIIDATTRENIEHPMAMAMRENRAVSLTPNGILIQRDGSEFNIEDSAAPIHDRRGHVTGAVMVFHDVSAARAMALRMSYLAQHDSLTDLPNRILFSDRLNQAITLADREHRKLAVLYLDLDRFKHANDTLGHSVGDELLKQVAQRLRNCVRGSDTVSRQGGDEFMVLLSQLVEAKDAALIATKILDALRAPYQIDVHELHLTVSIGIALYPDDGPNADMLLNHSDFAMYQAKDGGRNNFQFYKADLNVVALQRHKIQSSLRQALQKQEFVLLYQPILNLKSGAIKGVEALIRWKKGQQEPLSPAQFIPVAEETGLIVPIGRWVLREACLQACAWQNAGLPPIRIAVNISAVELHAPDFVVAVRNILDETGLRPEYLELELTETFLMRDEKATASTLNALNAMGVRMALDDFGTGYSSLSYVKRMPISCLKVDRSFVRSLGRVQDSDDASIVSAVINMGKSMNVNVVAEGVETLSQLDFLKAQGCPEGQGYYFSRPVTHDGMEKLMNDSVAALRRITAGQARMRQAPYTVSASGN